MSKSPRRKRKVLSVVVAEVDPSTRRTFVTALSHAGFAVVDVCSGHEALQIAREQHPDAVITNLQLSDMDGVDLTKQIKSDPETRDIPVVGVSCAPAGDRDRIGRAGFDQVMVDSCGPEHLLADVRGVLSDDRERRPTSRRVKRR